MSKVSIIITTWLEKNKKYLDLCIQSIKNLNYPQNLIEVILVARPSYMPLYTGVSTVSPPEDNFSNARGMNFGFKQAAKDSKYFFYLNDDVFLTPDCLKNMIEVVGDRNTMANPISPCDNGGPVQLQFGFLKGPYFYEMTGNFFKYEVLKEHLHDLMNAKSLYPRGVIRVGFLCMYATLIPRKVYELVGDFDEVFRTGQDDLDYCERAKVQKVDHIMCLDALVWHFGGVTSSETITAKTRLDNIEHFKAKYGRLPTFVNEESVEHFKKGLEWDTFIHEPERTETVT